MALFDKPAAQILAYVARKEREMRRLEPRLDWPRASSLVLEEAAALEIGNPKHGSLAALLWTESEIGPSRVLLDGPDLPDIDGKRAPFGMFVVARARVEDELEAYRELRDAVYDVKLEGMMSRAMPGRMTAWARINRQAKKDGLSLAHLGGAIVENVSELDFVSAVIVLFVTSSRRDLDDLAGAAQESMDLISVIMKLGTEKVHDCDVCDYKSICESVEELKKMRRKMREEKA